MVSSTSEGYTASQPLYQPSHATEQRPQKEPIDQIQASSVTRPHTFDEALTHELDRGTLPLITFFFFLDLLCFHEIFEFVNTHKFEINLPL